MKKFGALILSWSWAALCIWLAVWAWDSRSTAATLTYTNTIKPAGGGNYTTLAAWEAAYQTNLVTADQISVAECYSGADADAVAIDGWTADATHYILIYTPTSERHAGKWDATKYYLTGTDASALAIKEDFVRVDGLQIAEVATSVGANVINISAVGTSDIRISNCILKGGNDATYDQSGLVVNDADATVSVWNTIVFNISQATSGNRSGIWCANSTAFNAYSCTVVGARRGFYRTAGTMTAKNCYAGSTSTADFAGTISLTTCASEDTTGSVGLTGIAVDTSTGAGHAGFTSVTGGSEDYHIKSGSALQNVGTDTSGDAAPLNFTTDIDGNPISGTWCVGADFYYTAAPATTTGDSLWWLIGR